MRRKSLRARVKHQHGERNHHRFCQEGRSSSSPRNVIYWLYVRWIFWSVERSQSLLFLQKRLYPHSLCVRCDQRVLPTRKHELWECPGNNLVAHEHMETSVHLVQLAHDFGESDQVLFRRGLMPRDWLPANEHTGCMEAWMWERKVFGEYADQNLFVASNGSGGTPKCLRQVASGVATVSLCPLSDASFELHCTRC